MLTKLILLGLTSSVDPGPSGAKCQELAIHAVFIASNVIRRRRARIVGLKDQIVRKVLVVCSHYRSSSGTCIDICSTEENIRTSV